VRKIQEVGTKRKRYLFVWRDALEKADGVSPQCYGVLMEFSKYADIDTGVCWPGHKRIARALRRKERYVRKYVVEALQLHWMRLLQRATSGGREPGRGLTAVYQLTVPGITGTPMPVIPKNDRHTATESPVRTDRITGTPVPPNSHRTPTEFPPRGEAKKGDVPEDVVGFFDVVREQVGITLEPTRTLVDEIRARMAQGLSARHVGGEIDARTWPAELESPEGLAVHRLRKLRGAA
jgi:hypothetical protein